MNNILFLTSISEYIHYGTVGALDNITVKKLETELKNVVRSYTVKDSES